MIVPATAPQTRPSPATDSDLMSGVGCAGGWVYGGERRSVERKRNQTKSRGAGGGGGAEEEGGSPPTTAYACQHVGKKQSISRYFSRAPSSGLPVGAMDGASVVMPTARTSHVGGRPACLCGCGLAGVLLGLLSRFLAPFYRWWRRLLHRRVPQRHIRGKKETDGWGREGREV